MSHPVTDPKSHAVRAWECFLAFLKLGCTSFGGPVAHLGFFRQEFVTRRTWVSEETYADLVALSQFLPGPASSQVGFALGYLRAGLMGAIAAFIGFTLPSAVIMIGCAYGFAVVNPASGWLHGLKVAAVAVVAQAVWLMAVRLCPDRARVTLAIIAACVVLSFTTAWIQLAVIASGALAGWLGLCGAGEVKTADEGFAHVRKNAFAVGCLILFAGLLIALPLLTAAFKNPWIQLADMFYRTGSMVFGGGHVILPLLQTGTVGQGLLTENQFLAGYGAAQALPGPLFTFSGYLGALILPGHGWQAGLWCLGAIFLPSFLLVLGVLPFWQTLRHNVSVRSALNGANAAVVGILLAALYQPVWTSAIDSSQALIMALAAFCALQFWHLPPWLIVIGCGVCGGIVLKI